MATTRISNITTTLTTIDKTYYVPVDSSTSGTKKLGLSSFLNEFLPKSGGSISGNLNVSNNLSAKSIKLTSKSITRDVDNEFIAIYGGSTTDLGDNRSGARMYLIGKSNKYDTPGKFGIETCLSTGVYSASLYGYSNGRLEWNGNNIVRKVNNSTADVNGNVTIPLNYLPTAGGIVTGALTLNSTLQVKNNTTLLSNLVVSNGTASFGKPVTINSTTLNLNNSKLILTGGNGTISCGSNLTCSGSITSRGAISANGGLTATTISSTGSITSTGAINANGGLKTTNVNISASNIIFNGGGYFIKNNVTNSFIGMGAGLIPGYNRSLSTGAFIFLTGKDDIYNSPGSFGIVTCLSNNTGPELRGYNTGKLLWNQKNIVRTVNSLNADNNGNANILSVITLSQYDDSSIIKNPNMLYLIVEQ